MDTAPEQPLIEDERLYGNKISADILNVSPSALRNSRYTGRLLGVPAPPYVKRGPTVSYKGRTLREWNDQFPEQLPLPGMG
jgi:hypothetical protein